MKRDLAKDKQMILFVYVITTPSADETKKKIRQRIKIFSLKSKYSCTYLSENDLGNRFVSISEFQNLSAVVKTYVCIFNIS